MSDQWTPDGGGSIEWSRALVSQTIWDGGATRWDVEGNTAGTVWDAVGPTTTYTPATSGTTTWTPE